jgi:hypothetical protein
VSRTSRVLSAASHRLSGAVTVWALIAATVGGPLLCQQFQSAAHEDTLRRQAANEASRLLCRWHTAGRVSFHHSIDGQVMAEVYVPVDEWASLSMAAREVVRADVSTAVRWHGQPISHYVIHDDSGAVLDEGRRTDLGTCGALRFGQ